MAQRRMMSLKIIDTDLFLEMPQGAQNLYFHFIARADDDGFVSSPKKIMKIVSSADDDLKILIAKKFVIPFENGVCVIRHWRIHNFIRSDRYDETVYLKEKNSLDCENNVYDVIPSGIPSGIPDGSKRDTQVRIGKDRLGKDRIISYTKKDKFLTDLLYKLVKQNYPFLKEKDYSKDYAEMNKLNRIDKWTYEQIEYIIRWSQQDDFWKQNIRSVAKLRKQFENLVVRAKEQNQKGGVIKT